MLEIFKDIHKGDTAYIACNGPSLNQHDTEGISKNEIVFALNRGYLKEDMKYMYLVTADKRIEKNFSNEIKNARGIKFCHTIQSENVVQYLLGMGKFSTDITKGMKLGHSVTIVALQIAFYMGFNKVNIIGMDHKFTYDNTKRYKGNQFSNISRDLNHFTDDYYSPNHIYRFQNLDALENSYREAREVYELHDRKLINASYQTRLPKEIIPRPTNRLYLNMEYYIE